MIIIQIVEWGFEPPLIYPTWIQKIIDICLIEHWEEGFIALHADRSSQLHYIVVNHIRYSPKYMDT